MDLKAVLQGGIVATWGLWQVGGAAGDPWILTPKELAAIDDHARRHAANTGLDVEYVRHSFEVQAGSEYVSVLLRDEFKERFGTSYRDPPNRLVVRLKGDVPVEPRQYPAGTRTLQVVFETGAKHSAEELNAAMIRLRPKFAEIVPYGAGAYVDQRTGEIVLFAQIWTAIDEANVPRVVEGFPIRVEHWTGQSFVDTQSPLRA